MRRSEVDPTCDYERVLGVGRGAEPGEVRTAWRQQARRLHPDTGGDAAVFERARQAYEVLVDPELAAHWRFLRAAHAAANPPPGRAPRGPLDPMPIPAARPPLRAVLRIAPDRSAGPAAADTGCARGTRLLLLMLVTLGAVALGMVPAAVGTQVPLIVTGIPAMVAAALGGWVVAVTVTTQHADAAHRVQVLGIVWALLSAAQLLVSWLAGAPLLGVLPIATIPLVMVTTVVLFPRSG